MTVIASVKRMSKWSLINNLKDEAEVNHDESHRNMQTNFSKAAFMLSCERSCASIKETRMIIGKGKRSSCHTISAENMVKN